MNRLLEMPAEFDGGSDEAGRFRAAWPLDLRGGSQVVPIDVLHVRDGTLDIVCIPHRLESRDDAHRPEWLVVCEESGAPVHVPSAIREETTRRLKRQLDRAACE